MIRFILLFFASFSLFATLEKIDIELNGHILTVEVADTNDKQLKGLMGRKELETGNGMLFIYEHSQFLSFWMKNTLIPLSIAFFDANQVLINLTDMDPPDEGARSLLHYKSKAPSLYALEVPQGWFEKKGVKPGMKFSFLNRSNRVHTLGVDK